MGSKLEHFTLKYQYKIPVFIIFKNEHFHMFKKLFYKESNLKRIILFTLQKAFFNFLKKVSIEKNQYIQETLFSIFFL